MIVSSWIDCNELLYNGQGMDPISLRNRLGSVQTFT